MLCGVLFWPEMHLNSFFRLFVHALNFQLFPLKLLCLDLYCGLMCLYLFEGNSISAMLSCAVMMRRSSSSTISSRSTLWTISALPTSSPQLVRVTKISLQTLYTSKDIVHLKIVIFYSLLMLQEDILKNVGNQAVSVPVVFHYMFWP